MASEANYTDATPAVSEDSVQEEGGDGWLHLPGAWLRHLLTILDNPSTRGLLFTCKTWRDLVLCSATDPCLSIKVPPPPVGAGPQAPAPPGNKPKAATKGKPEVDPAKLASMAWVPCMHRPQMLLGRAALICNQMELRLGGLDPVPRIRGLWEGQPERQSPAFPSKELTTGAKELLQGAAYFVNSPLTAVTKLSLQGTKHIGLVPDFLGAFLPNLTAIRLSSSCLIMDPNAPPDPIAQHMPKCNKLAYVRIEHTEFTRLNGAGAELEEPKPFSRSKTLVRPSKEEVQKCKRTLLMDLPSLTSLELWVDQTYPGSSWAFMVLAPAFGDQLKQLTVGTVQSLRLASFCLPTLTTWSEHLKGLTHLNLGATGWIIDNQAAQVLGALNKTLTHVTVMSFGLCADVVAPWQNVVVTCRDSELHLPSLGHLILRHLRLPIEVQGPPLPVVAQAAGSGAAAAAAPKMMRVCFNNLAPGCTGDVPDAQITEAVRWLKEIGIVFKTTPGQPGLHVTLESTKPQVWEACLDLFVGQIVTLQMDRGIVLDEVLLDRLATLQGASLTHLMIIDFQDICPTVWADLLAVLPHVTKLSVLGNCDAAPPAPPEHFQALLSKLDAGEVKRSLALTVSTTSKKWAADGQKLLANTPLVLDKRLTVAFSKD